MNQNIEFLNYILQNAEMGKDSINDILGVAPQGDFKNVLTSQMNEYTTIYDQAKQMIEQAGKDAKHLNPMAKAATYVTTKMKTLTDKTPSHIAEMIIQGSTMGIIDITKNLKKYPDATNEIKQLGQRLLTLEENNVNEAKRFLQ